MMDSIIFHKVDGLLLVVERLDQADVTNRFFPTVRRLLVVVVHYRCLRRAIRSVEV